MSGIPRPPTERNASGLDPVALSVIPTFTPHRVRDAGLPVNGHKRQRQVPAERPLLSSDLELGPLLTAAGAARGHVRAVLMEWGLGELIDATGLLVSELITNAVLATRALGTQLPCSVRLWLHANRKRVLVTVWDANPQLPILQQDVDAWAENGRGLQILDDLSSRWGWYEPPAMGGKCVWCEIPREPAF